MSNIKLNDILKDILAESTAGKQYSKNKLIQYLDQLDPNFEVFIPKIYPGAFSPNESLKMTAEKAIKALNQTDLDGKFEIFQDKPTFKKISLIQTPKEIEKMTNLIAKSGPKD